MSRALETHVLIEDLYFAPGLFLAAEQHELVAIAQARGGRLFELSEAAFRRAAYRDRPDGLLGLARQFPTGIDRLELTPNPLLLAVEGLEKPGNLGMMLRTAEAAGVAGVVVCDPTTDLFNPNVVRASLGSLFTVPVAVTSAAEAIRWFGAHAISSFAATPLGHTDYVDADYTGPAVLVVGSEHSGLSAVWLDEATYTVRIGMRGSIDSLNAAMAAGILLFEAVRQRRTRTTQ